MASSEQQCLRFFVLACGFSLFVGAVGCATNNWSKPLFHQGNESDRLEQSIGSFDDHGAPTDQAPPSLKQQWNSFWNAGFGSSSGLDPKAREIEKSLGL